MIPIASPIIEEDEINAVNQVLKSGMLAQGPKVLELEEEFAKYCGTKYAVAVNSGTAAIHCALFAAGVGPGDEVITTPFSFIATANPIIMLGAKPVFVDIDPLTYNLDPEKIEGALTEKTKAILPVHLYGQIADMDEIKQIADKHNLLIIEDACQAIGAEYKGKKAGALGDMGCFSLYATKNIMCGEGGVITTNDESMATKMRQFRQHGMSGTYQYEHLGYNYRTTDLCASIAVTQLSKVDRFNGARVKNANQLTEGLGEILGLSVPVVGDKRSHVYHQYTIKVKNDFKLSRDKLLEYLRSNGVGAGVYYPKPLHLIPHISSFGYKKSDMPVTEEICEQVLSLPVHPRVKTEDINKIINLIKAL